MHWWLLNVHIHWWLWDVIHSSHILVVLSTLGVVYSLCLHCAADYVCVGSRKEQLYNYFSSKGMEKAQSESKIHQVKSNGVHVYSTNNIPQGDPISPGVRLLQDKTQPGKYVFVHVNSVKSTLSDLLKTMAINVSYCRIHGKMKLLGRYHMPLDLFRTIDSIVLTEGFRWSSVSKSWCKTMTIAYFNQIMCEFYAAKKKHKDTDKYANVKNAIRKQNIQTKWKIRCDRSNEYLQYCLTKAADDVVYRGQSYAYGQKLLALQESQMVCMGSDGSPNWPTPVALPRYR